MRRRLRCVLPLMIVGLWLAFPLQAGAYERGLLAGHILWRDPPYTPYAFVGYGMSAANWVNVSSSQTPYSGNVHENVVMVASASGLNNVRVGWYRRYGVATAQYFTAYTVNGVPQDSAGLGGSSSSGTATFKLLHVPGSGFAYQVYVNGYLMKTWQDTGLRSTIAQFGSARNGFRDTPPYMDDSGSWNSMKYVNADTNAPEDWYSFASMSDLGTVGDSLYFNRADPYCYFEPHEELDKAYIKMEQ